jgi:TolA-binding protein
MIDTEKLPGDPTEVNDVKDEKEAGEQVKDLKPSSMLAEVEPTVSEDETTEEVSPIPADTDKEEMGMPEMMKKVEEMGYRIEEMEKKISKMTEVKMEEGEEVEEEELPKLDGAPIDEMYKFSAEQNNKRFGKKVDNSQNSFLSKLYK